MSTSPPASTLLDAIARGLPPLLRASPHCYNAFEDLEDLEVLANAIRALDRGP